MQSRSSRALIAKGVRKSIVIIHFRSVACSAKSLQLSADRLFERKIVGDWCTLQLSDVVRAGRFRAMIDGERQVLSILDHAQVWPK